MDIRNYFKVCSTSDKGDSFEKEYEQKKNEEMRNTKISKSRRTSVSDKISEEEDQIDISPASPKNKKQPKIENNGESKMNPSDSQKRRRLKGRRLISDSDDESCSFHTKEENYHEKNDPSRNHDNKVICGDANGGITSIKSSSPNIAAQKSGKKKNSARIKEEMDIDEFLKIVQSKKSSSRPDQSMNDNKVVSFSSFEDNSSKNRAIDEHHSSTAESIESKIDESKSSPSNNGGKDKLKKQKDNNIKNGVPDIKSVQSISIFAKNESEIESPAKMNKPKGRKHDNDTNVTPCTDMLGDGIGKKIGSAFKTLNYLENCQSNHAEIVENCDPKIDDSINETKITRNMPKLRHAQHDTEIEGFNQVPSLNPNSNQEFVSTNSDHNVLKGCKVVFTGVFKSMSREEIAEKSKKAGCLVMSVVSGKTNYLVCGNILEDGRHVEEGSKFKKASDLLAKNKSNIKIIDENRFVELLNLSNITSDSRNDEDGCIMLEKKAESNEEEIKNADEFKSTLWTDKYRPKNLSDLVDGAQQYNQLSKWLNQFDSGRATHRCALLSGPPGIGKTTIAHLVAKSSQYNVIEYNASDERNKLAIDDLQHVITGGFTINYMNRQKELKKTCIIFDEVDGMSSGDRGGISALLKIISNSNCPIICICNDRMNPKVRSLAKKCCDIRFARPKKNLIAKRIASICSKEGMSIEHDSIEEICEASSGDIRQIINSLQFMHSRGGITIMKDDADHLITYRKMREEIDRGKKDTQVMLSAFDASKKLLCQNDSKLMKLKEKMDFFFVDYDLVPMLLQENYITAINNVSAIDDCQKLNKICQASLSFAYADIIKKNIVVNQNWSLLTDFAALSCIVPVHHCSGFIIRQDFPRWLGKQSTRNKNKRLAIELKMCLLPYTTISSTSLQISGYVDLFYRKCIGPLIKASQKNLGKEIINALISESLAMIDIYGLNKQLLLENMGSLILKGNNIYDLVDSKIKGLFSRRINEYSQSNSIEVKKSVKKKVQNLELIEDDKIDSISDDSLSSEDNIIPEIIIKKKSNKKINNEDERKYKKKRKMN